MIALHAIQATVDYLEWLAAGEIGEFEKKLKDFHKRVSVIDILHEAYLVNKAGKEDTTQDEKS